MQKFQNTHNSIFLSHILDKNTPSYGNKNPLFIEAKKSLWNNDSCNDSYIHMSAHLGTHIDMPLHFYKNGQSIADFPADFWAFNCPIYIKIKPLSLLVYQEIIDALRKIAPETLQHCDILLVNTGIGDIRHTSDFWEQNPGFSSRLYDFFKLKLPSLRIFGFDSISLTSFQHREIGRQAHLTFLNPKSPILLIEDMKLNQLQTNDALSSVIVSPIQINDCDGLPCTVMGFLNHLSI